MSDHHSASTSSEKSEEESPTKRIKLYDQRKSWSLMGSKADQEALLEMEMSYLQYDDSEVQTDVKHSGNTAYSNKKKYTDIENVNPNVNKGVSPQPLASKSPKSPKRKSPQSGEKFKPVASVELHSPSCMPDEETPSGQSVSSEYHKLYASMLDSRSNCGRKRRASYTTRDDTQDSIVLCKSSKSSSDVDAFGALSDEMMLSIFWWLPKLSLQNCMLVSKRWRRIASDETLWPKLDLSMKVLNKYALGNILSRKPILLRLCYTEISDWIPSGPPIQSKLQYLDLSMANISADTLDHLMATCRNLRKLSLENVPLKDSTCWHIGECSQLETLNLTMALGIQAEGLLKIAKGCTSLLSLNISWCYLSEEALQNLVSNISPTVQRLNIAGSRLLTDDMVATLAANCSRLLEIDLSDCSRLTGASVTAILGLRRLEHLALSRCYLLQPDALISLNEMPSLIYLDVFGMLPSATLNTLRSSLKDIQLNQFRFSAIARPTVGVRRTSIWGLKTRD